MFSNRTVLSFAVALGACGALAAPSWAQTLYGLQGPNSRVVEMSGPPAGLCGFPDGLMASQFNFAQASPCAGVPAPAAFVPGAVPEGDVAVDRQNDIVFATDGNVIGEYDANTGVLLRDYPANFLGLVPPLTGLGWDSANGWLWVCDAMQYGALQPNGTCMPVPQVAAIAAPAGVPFLTDIDRDVKTGQIWVCDVGGGVSHFPVGAAAPTNYMVVTGLAALCGGMLNVPLTGLALNPATGAPVFTVTDGTEIAQLVELGAGFAGNAPSNFAHPMPCFVGPGGPMLLGLGFAAHGVTYGNGNGLLLDSRGQTTLPSATFRLDVGAGPAGPLYLVYSFAPLCPQGMFSGAPLLLNLGGFWGFLGPVPYGGGGMSFPIALPGGGVLPFDLSIWMQGFVQGAGGWVSSNGLEFTLSRP